MYKYWWIILLALVIIIVIIKYISFFFVLWMMNNFYKRFLGTQEYYPTNMKWCEILRQNYTVIRDEYIEYVKMHGRFKRIKDIDPNQAELDSTPIPWKVLFLRCYNADTEKMKLFPKTFELLKRVPGCTLAMFSILKPGQYLPPHYGPYKGVLRYHLSLIIPKDYKNCYLEVNGQRYCWEEGGDVIFDDSLEHRVFNKTNETRVVLFMDIQRRFDSVVLNGLNTALLYLFKFNNTINNIVKKTNGV